MNGNGWIRQTHRWVSIIFTAAVVVTFVALARKTSVGWVSYLPLPPLFLLLFTGLYLFASPYVRRRGKDRLRA